MFVYKYFKIDPLLRDHDLITLNCGFYVLTVNSDHAVVLFNNTWCTNTLRRYTFTLPIL